MAAKEERVVDHIETYARPQTVDEAIRLRQKWEDAARFVGGGVDLALYTPPSVRALIDLSGLGISSIRAEDGDLRIGATVTITELMEDDSIAAVLDGLIVEGMRSVASPLLRNLATVGGSLVSRHPWSDVIPLFLVLDAEVSVRQAAARWIPLASFLEEREAWADGLVLEARIPAAAPGSAAAFEKFSRTEFDVAMLNCAGFAARSSDGRCAGVRIAVGGTPRLAARVERVEAALIGEALDEDAIDSAARLAAKEVAVGDDRRASASYRRRLVEVGVRRVLTRIAAGRGGEER